MSDKFKIEHQDDPPLWTIYKWQPRLGFRLPFSSTGQWISLGTAKSEKMAKVIITNRRVPYIKTTYYDEHGHEDTLKSSGWA